MVTFHRFIMKQYLFLALLAFAPAFLQAQTQGEMNHQSAIDFQKIDKELNETYFRIMPKLNENAQKKLKETELQWLAYRESQARLEADVIAEGGSMSRLIYNEARARITEVRIKELKDLLRVMN